MSTSLFKTISASRQNAIIAVIVAAIIVLAGITLILTKASGFFAGVEPDDGTLTANAKLVTDANASGGKAIQFTAPTPPPSPPTPTPTPPTPPPSSGNTCPPYPQFPDAACTGVPAGVTLSNYTGPTTINTAGTVIQNVQINASHIRVNANNVVFKNCKIVYNGAVDGGFTLIYIPAGVTGVTFDHCEIDGQNKIARAIQGISGVIVRNSNIHHTGNAVEVDTNITMTDNYIHDIFTPSGLDWHADGVQSGDSASNITIDHNTILLTAGETGAINIVSNGGVGTFSNILIQNNLMAGGGYTVYAGTSAAKTSNFRIINNHFSKRYYPKVGMYNIWYETYMSAIVRTGNVIAETGASANTGL